MSWFDFDWVDAFTARPFGGNGCAVVHGGVELSDETCMAFVRETALVECTFTGPSDKADIRVRCDGPFSNIAAAMRDDGCKQLTRPK